MAAEDPRCKIVFIDTNVFLHFRMFTDIDWPKIADCQSVVLTVAQVVLSELNDKKDGSTPKLRDRAASALKKLELIDAKGEPFEIRKGVTLHLQSQEPRLDYDAHGLEYRSNDDRLLASVLAYQAASPDSQIVVVTDDLGLRVKARRHGIAVIDLPDELKLPEELDPQAKRIRELERKVVELQSMTPDLRLTFGDDVPFLEIELEVPITIASEDIAREKDAIRSLYKKFNDKPNPLKGLFPAVDLVRALALPGLSKEVIERYDRKMDEFYLAHDEYLEAKAENINREKRTVELKIVLSNEGTAPAEDIDIRLHFPDGFELFNSKPESGKAVPPSPPRRPTGLFDEIAEAARLVPGLGIEPIPEPFHYAASAPTIRKTNSYEVDLHFPGLKHNMLRRLSSLYVVFDSYETAASFQIGYQIVAANVAKQIEGELNVVIRKPS